MRSLLKFLLIVLFVVVASAVLAPFLYKFLPYKFERIFNRLIMIFTLTAVVIAIKRKAMVFPKGALEWRGRSSLSVLTVSFLIGFLTLFSLAFLKVSLGVMAWSITEINWLSLALAAVTSLFAALLIGVIEETFFRGFFYTALREKACWAVIPSLAATNVFYSIVHFVHAKKPFIGPNPEIADSFKLVAAPLSSLLHWETFILGAIGLFIFGCILSLAYLRTRSLYPCIGLHAGCVFFLKMDTALTSQASQNSFLWGSGKGYDGLLGWAFLAFMGFVLLKLLNKRVRVSALVLLLITVGLSSQHAYSQSSSWLSFEEDESAQAASEQEKALARNASPLSLPVENEPADASAERASVEPEVRAAARVSSEFQGLQKTVPTVEPGDVDRPRPSAVIETDDEGTPGIPPRVISPVPEEHQKRISERSSSLENRKLPSEEVVEAAKRTPIEQQEDFSSSSEFRPHESNIPPSTDARKGELESHGVEAQSGVSPQAGSLIADELPSEVSVLPTKKNADVSSADESRAAYFAPEPGAYRAAAEEEPKKGSSVLSENIDGLRVSLLSGGVVVNRGQWNGQAFAIPELGEEALLEPSSDIIGGEAHEGLRVKIPSAATLRLSYPHISPGSRLILRYGVPDAKVEPNQFSAVYVKVFAGKHFLKRFRILNETGWKQESVSLGPALFLKESVILTLDFTSDQKELRELLFEGQIV